MATTTRAAAMQDAPSISSSQQRRRLSSTAHIAARPSQPRALRAPRSAPSTIKAAVQEPLSLGSLKEGDSLPTFVKDSSIPSGKPRIVVLGSGWGAMSFMKSLSKETAANYDITVVSPRNYFVYTPLLPAVASGTCEERSIVEPVRKFVAGKGNFFEAVCQSVDVVNKKIVACFPKDSGFPEACFQVPYDILVVSVGSTTNTFGCPGVEENCLFFKSIEDAKALRKQLSECFERAALPYTSDEEKATLLSFVVVGGGPTGVEVAAEVHDMIVEDLERLYPTLIPFVKIRIIELMDHVLGTYDRAISDFTAREFKRSGIELVTNSRVNGVTPSGVQVYNTKTEEMVEIPYGACVWATGIKMNPLVKQIQQVLPEGTQNHFRCLVTDSYLRVKGSEGSIYCLGDAGTVAEDKAQERAAELFKEGDVNNDGTLSLIELRDILLKGADDFPQMAEYATFLDGKAGSNRFGALTKSVLNSMRKDKNPDVAMSQELLGEMDMSTTLTLKEFETLLSKIDAGLRGLPATAQVANQQGAYLAKLLSSTKLDAGVDLSSLNRFEYSHKGSLAYVGSDKAVLDAPFIGAIFGRGVGVLWKGYETYGQFSVRNRVLVATDWLRAKIFGRDISRI